MDTLHCLLESTNPDCEICDGLGVNEDLDLCPHCVALEPIDDSELGVGD